MGLFSNLFKNEPTKPIKDLVDELLNLNMPELLDKSVFVDESISPDETQTIIKNYVIELTPPIFNYLDKIEFKIFGDKDNFININMVLTNKSARTISTNDITRITKSFCKIFDDKFTSDDSSSIELGNLYKSFEKDNTYISIFYQDDEGLTITRHNAYMK